MTMSKEEWQALRERRRREMEEEKARAQRETVTQAQEAMRPLSVVERVGTGVLGWFGASFVFAVLAAMVGPLFGLVTLLLGIAVIVIVAKADRRHEVYDRAGRRVGTMVADADDRVEVYGPGGKHLGWAQRRPDGRYEAFAPDGHRLGWYDPTSRQISREPEQ